MGLRFVKLSWHLTNVSIVFFLLFTLNVKAAAAEVVIIVNPSVGIHSMNRKDVKDIFLGRKMKWNTQNQIQFVVQKETPVHAEFTRTILRKPPSKYKKWLLHMAFTGQGVFPKTFKNEDQLVQYVAETEGAIGYVSENTVIKGVYAVKLVD